MKHYGAVLTGDNNILDGGESSILNIGTAASNNDVIVIHNDNTTTGTSDAASDGSVAGLVIVPSTSGRGATHVIGADGREVAIASLGSVNSVTADFPVKGIDASGNSIFVNSIISEVAPAGGLNYDATADGATNATNSNATGVQVGGNLELTNNGNLTVAGNASIVGNLVVTGSTQFNHQSISQYADTFIELNVAQDKSAADTNGIGGVLVEHSFDANGANARYGGLRFNGAANSNVGQWEYNLAADVNGAATVNTNTGATGEWIPFASGTLTGITEGNGINVSTTATEDGNTGTAAAPLVSVALTTTAAGEGGLEFDNPTGDGNSTIGIAQAGITEQMLNATGTAGTAGQILSLADPALGTFQWVAAGGTGTINRYVETGTKAAATTSVTVGSTAITATSGITAAEQNLTITVFESTTNGFSQIIPESIVIADGTGGTNAGDVVVTFGATANDLAYKIIFLG